MIRFVAEQPRNAQQRAILNIQEREDTVEQQLFQARALGVLPHMMECGGHVASHEEALLPRHGFQNVQAHGIIMIGRIEIDDLTRAVRGHVIQRGADQVPVRADDREAMLRTQVMRDEVLQDSALACCRFPGNVRVESPILVQDAEDAAVVAEIDARKKAMGKLKGMQAFCP